MGLLVGPRKLQKPWMVVSSSSSQTNFQALLLLLLLIRDVLLFSKYSSVMRCDIKYWLHYKKTKERDFKRERNREIEHLLYKIDADDVFYIETHVVDRPKVYSFLQLIIIRPRRKTTTDDKLRVFICVANTKYTTIVPYLHTTVLSCYMLAALFQN